ncbi:hypothetical protein Cni_G09963 [Canna indica]|uniref:Remorin C-terminal domain-containing protein n=1 Tax=Canna indica TaxID=4628 RepID=A0AAQ3K6M6_9LILI|nr:hypothetical protein Cni_G09963 [Canna indica]
MRPVDDKGSYIYESSHDNSNSNTYSFEFHNGGKALHHHHHHHHHHKALGSRSKPTPSKWDDAQKWLVGFSGRGGDHTHFITKPRNSNADDRRLLTSLSQIARDSCSSADGVLEDDIVLAAMAAEQEGETKKIDCNESMVVRSVCLRDTGTEMTPIASKEPSRTGTPFRATTPVLKSPISSRSSTPGRGRQGDQQHVGYQPGMRNAGEALAFGRATTNGWPCRGESEMDGGRFAEINGPEQDKNLNSLESHATAWDEAERAKYMARYKREEVKIQAWENHEKRKAEMEMRRIEVKAERMKSRAQEKYANKLAAARMLAEERRANAEARLNEQAGRTSERADYIRRTGHLPSSFFSFKLHSLFG